MIGGRTEDDLIKNIMAEVIGASLSKTFSWHGKKGKRGFKTLELSKVVFGKNCSLFGRD